MYDHIMVSIDGSEAAARAVDHAAELAKRLQARLTIVTVTEQAPSFDEAEIGWSVPGDVYDQIRRAGSARSEAILKGAMLKASGRDISAASAKTEADRPYEGILELAEKIGADLIVMGSSGRTGINRLILGSQASKVLAMARVPVLIVK